MPGDKGLLSLGVEDLGVTGVFEVPGVCALGVTGEVALWIPSKVVFWVTDGSMFTVFFPNQLIPKT